MKKEEMTIIICCAGMGTRLGIGVTKALLDICGKPLILRQLDMLSEYEDIRVVVGYQAEKVIEVINECRQDIMYAFNYSYKTTGVAASLSKALIGTRKYVVAIDGDLLIRPKDFQQFMMYSGECIGISKKYSDEPVLVDIENGEVISFQSESGEYEWSGIVKVEASKLIRSDQHVFDMLTPLLPLPAFFLESREVDTQDDYDRMIEWIERNYEDNGNQ